MTVDVLRSASPKAHPGSIHVPASARNTRALLELDPVLDELERRAAVGLSSILSRSLLEVLCELPVDLPVELQRLSESQIRVLRKAPPGCVEFSEGHIIRRAVPPVRVVSAGVCASTWADGLRQASQFASYCTRYAVLTSPSFDEDAAVMEARFYGIGLATMTRGAESFEWRLAPETFVATRETVASWHFAETALDAFAHSTRLVR